MTLFLINNNEVKHDRLLVACVCAFLLTLTAGLHRGADGLGAHRNEGLTKLTGQSGDTRSAKSTIVACLMQNPFAK